MTNGDVTPDVLDQLQEQRAVATQRQIAADAAREMWSGHVNDVLRALADKLARQDARITALEAGRG